MIPDDFDLTPMIAAGVWKHYKGGLYQLIGIGQHTETEELMVVYVSLTGAELPGPRMRVRPLTQWVERVKWPEGFHQPRFRYVGIGT